MIWVVILLIILVTIANAYLIYTIRNKADNSTEHLEVLISQNVSSIKSVDRRLDDTINKANANDIRLNNMATRNKLDIARANKQIDDIIIKLQEITADIHRLDGNITDVAKSEHEIRSYYVNFREPRFDNAGVEWSEEYVTNDD